MISQTLGVANGQAEDVTLGLNAEVCQGIRISNQSPLTLYIVFADLEDTIEAWKWVTYEGQDSKVHLEAFVLPGDTPNTAVSNVIINAYAKGEKMPRGTGALTGQVAQPSQSTSYLMATINGAGNAPLQLHIVSQKKVTIYIDYLLISVIGPTATPATLTLSFTGVNGRSSYNIYFNESQQLDASKLIALPQSLAASGNHVDVLLNLSAGNALQHEITAWYYLA